MPEPLRVLIADDEPLARVRLADLLAAEPDVTVVGTAADGVETVEQIRRLSPDLVLLDIQMPESDGFDVIAALEPEERPAIVFVTAFAAHAARAFDVHAVDYVLKPVAPERLHAALTRVRERRDPPELEQYRRALDEARGNAPPPDRLLVRAGERIRVVPIREIHWVESASNYARLHLAGERLLYRSTITELEPRLAPFGFARIHRGTLVNLDRVRTIEPGRDAEYAVVLEDGARVPLSRTYRDALFDRLGRPH